MPALKSKRGIKEWWKRTKLNPKNWNKPKILPSESVAESTATKADDPPEPIVESSPIAAPTQQSFQPTLSNNTLASSVTKLTEESRIENPESHNPLKWILLTSVIFLALIFAILLIRRRRRHIRQKADAKVAAYYASKPSNDHYSNKNSVRPFDSPMPFMDQSSIMNENVQVGQKERIRRKPVDYPLEYQRSYLEPPDDVVYPYARDPFIIKL